MGLRSAAEFCEPSDRAITGLFKRLEEAGGLFLAKRNRRQTVLNNAELATITGVKTRQVQHWAAGTHRPQGEAKDRLLELHYILERLRDVCTTEGKAPQRRGNVGVVRDIAAAVSHVGTVTITGRFQRHVSPRQEPLRGSRSGGRWGSGGAGVLKGHRIEIRG